MPQIVQVVATRIGDDSTDSNGKIQKALGWLMHSGIVVESVCTQNHEAIQDPSEKAQPDVASKTATKTPKMFDPSAIRIPLLNADELEKAAVGWQWLISVPSLCVAIAIWGSAIVIGCQNNDKLVNLGQKLFVPGSQWWWLVAWGVLKAVHEAGHAIACVRVGAKPKGAGVNFMFLAPLPYVDASNLWSVENKWHRILVSLAGMLFEITLAALAVIGACYFENPNLRYLCFTIATLGTFTTIAFNGNPLMRYDGYYVMVDLFERPNLWQDASKAMKDFFAKLLFTGGTSSSYSLSLLSYGIASWCSRMLMLGTMGWGIWMTWDGIGLILVGFFATLWFAVPFVLKTQAASVQSKQGVFIATLKSISIKKAVLCGIGSVALVLCSFLPSPVQISWPAIVDYVDPANVRTLAAGFVSEVFVHDGQGVREGEEIVRLSNPTLELEFLAAQSALRSCEEKCSSLRAQRKHAELQAEEAVQVSLKVQCESLKNKVDSLVLRAPRDGVLLARRSQNLKGSFVPEGQSIGLVVNPKQIEIRASVPQYAWETVSHNVEAPVSITMASGQHWAGKILTTHPRTSDSIEWPSLGGIYGGPIAIVKSKDENGKDQMKTNSPRLQTQIQIDLQASVGGLLDFGSSRMSPPPGSTCSVQLQKHNEAIWQTGYRWIRAALEKQLDVPS